MKTVFVAGATGYLGRHLVKAYTSRGWRVRALARRADAARASGLRAAEIVEAEATDPHSLRGAMEGVDLAISSLGVTRQRDGLSYWDVDFQANANLLETAIAANVARFAYVHVLNAEAMAGIPLVDAKEAFANRLRAAPIASTIIRPSGFFSDMAGFYDMAKAGRIWLFGDGSKRLNPIDGADLAAAIGDAVQSGADTLDIGGPDILTQREVAELAFSALGEPAKITLLPDVLRRAALRILPWMTPAYIHGPAQFFLTALGRDMVGRPTGSRRLNDHFAELRRRGQTPATMAIRSNDAVKTV